MTFRSARHTVLYSALVCAALATAAPVCADQSVSLQQPTKSAASNDVLPAGDSRMGLAQPLTDKAAPAAKTATAPSPTIVADKGGVELTAEETNSVITAILEPQAQPGDSAAKVQEPSLISRIASATKNLVRRAASWLGARYAWGGTSRKGVDCSGLTKILYADEGIGLPHSARQQFKLGQKVAKNDMAPGDLVFFNTRGPISHVGIYIGNNQFVHAANRRRGVRVDSLGSAYYSKRFAGARRYKDVG